MKSKKLLCLMLTMVMLLTLFPLQGILASANKMNYPTTDLGEATKFVLSVSSCEDGHYMGLIQVDFQISIDKSKVAENDRSINLCSCVFSVDSTKLSPVSSAAKTRGQSTLSDVLNSSAAKASDGYYWSKYDAGSKFALIAGGVPVEEDTAQFSVETSGLSYNPTTQRLYFQLHATELSGLLWTGDGLVTVMTTYLRPADGVTLADVSSAIALAQESEIRSTTDGCLTTAVTSENIISSKTLSNRFVTDSNLVFSDELQPPISGGTINGLDSVFSYNKTAGITVSLLSNNETVQSLTTTADEGFRFSNVPAGTYDVRLAATGSLGFRFTNVTVVTGEETVLPQITLIFGDENQNGMIDLVDISAIITMAQKQLYSEAGDANGNGYIELSDLTTVIYYYATSDFAQVLDCTSSGSGGYDSGYVPYY